MNEENEFFENENTSIKDSALDMFRTDIDDDSLGFRSIYSDLNYICFAADGMFQTY